MIQDETPASGSLDFAKLDLERKKRRGIPEAVLCEGKTPEQTAKILETLSQDPSQDGFALGTRASPEQAAAIQKILPQVQYFSQARILLAGKWVPKTSSNSSGITVLSAGTSDIPVAEEAAVTAEILGSSVQRIYDVGVAGIHRLMSRLPEIRKASVLIVVAGMDGALASVVSGLSAVPVIAVPTSVGYGASFGGIAALLSMLNSCSPGVSVVNIDNGFGAACSAVLITQKNVLSTQTNVLSAQKKVPPREL